MLVLRIEGTTRTLGKQQGYMGLPVRDQIMQDGAGQQFPVMVSAWQPTPAELALLNAGASIHLGIVGAAHPPVLLTVGPAPTDGG